MKKCSKCGAEADESARFCPKCGNPLDEAPQPTGETPQPTGGGGRKPVQNTKMYSVLGFIPPILLILFAALSMLFFIAPVAVTPGMTILGEKIPAENSGNVYKFSELGELGVTGSAISLIIFAIILLVIAFILLVVCVNAKTRNSYFSFGNKKITVRSFLSVLGYIFVIVQFITACAMFAQISEADGGLGLIEAGAAPILILVFSLIFGVISAVCAGACVYLAKKRPELAQSVYGANAGEWLKRNKKPVIVASVIIAVVLILSIVLPVTITTVKKNKHNGTYYYYDAAADEYDRDYYIKLNGDKFTDSDGETGKVKFDGEKVTFTTEFFGIEDVAEGTIKNHVIKLGGNTFVSEKHKHEYDWETATEPTCETAGLEKGICECGKIGENREIKALGHTFNENLICSVCSKSGFTFEQNDTGYTLSGVLSGAERNEQIIIPDTYNGLSVTKIGYEAFKNCYSLTSVTIPESVTSIGGDAFEYCRSLTSVTIPESVTAIGVSVFGGCSKLESIEVAAGNANYVSQGGILYNKEKTEIVEVPQGIKGSVTISEGVTSIDSSAFEDCRSLTSVTIPASVTYIGSQAFYYCTSLASVTIPTSVTYIGSQAFYYCTSLTSISIPTSVTSIGDKAFENTAIYNNSNNWVDNVLYIDNCLIEAERDISGAYEIKSGTRLIAESAFEDCASLTSITIPDSVTEIGEEAFYYCTSLASVTIPTSVTSIGDGAFKNTAIYNNSNNWVDNVLYIDNCLIEAERDISGACDIKSGTRLIADSAFRYRTSLTSVTIPAGVTYIGEEAFYKCTALTSVTIPAGVTYIGEKAFYKCTALTSITIPESVTKIGDYAFYYCTSLKRIDYKGTVDEWKAITKGDFWNENTGNYTVYCTDGSITKRGVETQA